MPRTGYLVELAPHESWSGRKGEWSSATAPSGSAQIIGRSASPRLSVAPAPWRFAAPSQPAAGPRSVGQLSHQASSTRKRCWTSEALLAHAPFVLTPLQPPILGMRRSFPWDLERLATNWRPGPADHLDVRSPRRLHEPPHDRYPVVPVHQPVQESTEVPLPGDPLLPGNGRVEAAVSVRAVESCTVANAHFRVANDPGVEHSSGAANRRITVFRDVACRERTPRLSAVAGLASAGARLEGRVRIGRGTRA